MTKTARPISDDRSRKTFLGAEKCELSDLPSRFDAVVFGASDATPHVKGRTSHAARAPRAIREATRGFQDDLSRWDFDQEGILLDRGRLRLCDVGDVVSDPHTPQANRARIRDAAKRILSVGAVPFLIGGDDSVPIPFFDAFDDFRRLTVLQVDAHLDWRHERGGSRHTFSSTMRRASEMPWVERIVQVGLRGIGGSRRDDLEDAERWGARIFTADCVRKEGIRSVLDAVEDDADCLITIDCDGLDPSVIPGVIVPQPGGLSYPQVVELIRGVARKARIVGFDIVELVPERDMNGLGALVAARLVCIALGCLRVRGAAGK